MKEFIKRLKILFYGKPKCEGCKKRASKSMYYRGKYLETKQKLQECEEILNLAINSIDLKKVKNAVIKQKYNNRTK